MAKVQHQIGVVLSESDKAAIEKAAARHCMSASEYGRACMLAFMVVDLDPYALKSLGRGFGNALKEVLASAVRENKDALAKS